MKRQLPRICKIKYIVAALFLTSASSLKAGELEPTGPPAPTMNTLEEIFGALQTGNSTSGKQFVGTTKSISPDLGVLALSRECQLDFGVTSRICTSTEIMDTFAIPVAFLWQTDTGWVRPEFVQPGGSAGEVVDSSGISGTPQELSCGSWSSTGQTAIAISGAQPGVEGRFLKLSCADQTTGVACCASIGS